MNPASPSPSHLRAATRLLALEDASDDRATTSAGRVYDKLHAHLAPLVGVTGIEALFLRSAKLTQGELSRVAQSSVLGGAAELRERLQVQELVVSRETATTLFATLLDLLSTFIGERLTAQVVHRAWPNLDETTLDTEKHHERR